MTSLCYGIYPTVNSQRVHVVILIFQCFPLGFTIPHPIQLSIRLQLHRAIYRPDSFVMMLRYCANLKAMRYESTSLKRIVADKSHRVIVA